MMLIQFPGVCLRHFRIRILISVLLSRPLTGMKWILTCWGLQALTQPVQSGD